MAQRNPLVLAKELAGVDVLSGGRLIFGVGVGYIKGEFDALGVPYAERGARVAFCSRQVDDSGEGPKQFQGYVQDAICGAVELADSKRL